MPQNVLWVLALCVMALIVCVLLGKLYLMRKACTGNPYRLCTKAEHRHQHAD